MASHESFVSSACRFSRGVAGLRGVEVNMAFRFVRQDVLVTTNYQQEPFV